MEHRIQPLPVNELHGVIVNSLCLTHAEDRHNIGVVQPRRRPRFPPEALQVSGIHQAVEGQNLERDVPAKRFLHRFIHDPHAAPPNFAQDTIIT